MPGNKAIIVYVMEEARDASLKGVERVHQVALTFAMHMGEGRDALGAILGQNISINRVALVVHLQGGRQVCVHFIVG